MVLTFAYQQVNFFFFRSCASGFRPVSTDLFRPSPITHMKCCINIKYDVNMHELTMDIGPKLCFLDNAFINFTVTYCTITSTFNVAFLNKSIID